MTALLLAIVSSAAMALALKWFRDPKGNRYGLLLGNYLTCVLIAFLTMPDRGAVLHGSAVTLICGLIGGCFFIAALVAMQSSIAKTGAALTAAFAKLGLTVSLLVSVLWFGERPTALQLGGIVLTLAALVVLHGGAKTGALSGGALVLLAVTLVTNGGGDAMAKVFSNLGPAEESVLYMFWVFLTALILACGLAFAEWKRNGKKLVWKEVAAGVAVGVPNYYSSYLLVIALGKLPAMLVFPAFSIGTILLVTVCSLWFFRERLTRRQAVGLALIGAALALLNL